MAHIGHLSVGGSKCNCSIKLAVSRSSPSNHFCSEKLLSYTYLKNVILSFCLICSYSNTTHLTCLLLNSLFVAIRTRYQNLITSIKNYFFVTKIMKHLLSCKSQELLGSLTDSNIICTGLCLFTLDRLW